MRSSGERCQLGSYRLLKTALLHPINGFDQLFLNAFQSLFVFDLIAFEIRDVKDVDDLIEVRTNLGVADREIQFVENARHRIEQSNAIVCEHVDNGAVGQCRVINHDSRRQQLQFFLLAIGRSLPGPAEDGCLLARVAERIHQRHANGLDAMLGRTALMVLIFDQKAVDDQILIDRLNICRQNLQALAGQRAG